MQKYTKRAEYKELLVFYAIIFLCKPASRPTGFGEDFSIRPAGRLKIFHQKPCIFSPRPYLPPETSKVKPPTRHKN